MFIVLAAPHYPPRNIGGVEFFVQALARGLHRQGHRVEVVSVERIEHGPFPRVTAQVDREEGFPVYRLTVGWRRGPAGLRDRYDNPAMELWFRAYFHSRSPDLFHLNSGYLLTVAPLRAAAQAGIPTVVSLHDFWFLCAHHTLLRPSGQVCPGPEDPAGCAYCWLSQGRRYRWMEKALAALGVERPHRKAGRLLRPWPFFRPWAQEMAARLRATMSALNQATAIHSPSRFLVQTYRTFGMRAERVSVIPYFVPPDLSSDIPRRERGGPREVRVVYIGQIAPHKGIHVLIEGFRRAKARLNASGDPMLRLAIYGNPQAFPAYSRLLEQRIAGDPAIRLAGVLPRERLREALAEADWLVLPSIWPEITGIVALEALAAGVPVLTSAVGGIPEVVHHGVNGWLVPPGDPEAIAQALIRSIREPEWLAQLRARAGPVFSFEQAMSAWISLYAEIAGRARTPETLQEAVLHESA
jgi:glycosyltransferase involved in cell wall biosynthesis